MRSKVYILSTLEKSISTVLLSLGSLLVAYLIGPEDYGKFGILFAAYLFSTLINDSGTATSILNFSLEYTSQGAAVLRQFNDRNSVISVLLFLLISLYYVIINFSYSWIASVCLLVLSLKVHSKTIIPHSILIKKNNYKELNKITFFSSIGALLATFLTSQLIHDFTLGSVYILSLVLFKFMLIKRTENGTFKSKNKVVKKGITELRAYSSWIFKISLTNQAYLIILDFILSRTIDFELLGKYKLDLFLINTLILTIGSSVERIWIANYPSYTDIPVNNKIKLVVLLYLLLFLTIPLHYGISVIITALGKADILLSSTDFFIVLLCYVSVPLQQLIIIRAKKVKDFMKLYSMILIIIRSLSVVVFFGFMFSLNLDFKIYLFGYAFASLLLFIVPTYFIYNGISNR